jgi:hypothetical protein
VEGVKKGTAVDRNVSSCWKNERGNVRFLRESDSLRFSDELEATEITFRCPGVLPRRSKAGGWLPLTEGVQMGCHNPIK